jgi:hypothetical protein
MIGSANTAMYSYSPSTEDMSFYYNDHLKTTSFLVQNYASLDDVAIEKRVITRSRTGLVDKATSLVLSSSADSQQDSLANQYLDTMIMDDVWRAACLRKIRQNQRKQRALKRRLALNSTKSDRGPRISQRHHFKAASKAQFKPGITPPTPPNSPQTQCRGKPSSPGSDSGFVSASDSPPPNPPTYFRVHSTRNYPLNDTTPTISIDIPASMVGRSCLSCRCTNTTCWRRTLGGIICNSCGLRCFKLLYS